MKKFFLASLITLFSAFPAMATNYWVTTNGAAANLAACSGATPLTGTAGCSYDKANGSGVVGGDTVYYRGGTYSGVTGSAINPYNTGTAGNVITFSAYNGETVEFQGSGVNSIAANLDSNTGTVRSYIHITGIKFTSFMEHLWIRRGSHNEVDHCEFTGFPVGATESDFAGVFAASYIYRHAQYNYIHDNVFGEYGFCGTGYDTACVLQVGAEGWAIELPDLTEYNIIENNVIRHGGHHAFGMHGYNNVYRGNIMYNDPWCPEGTPVFGTRSFQQTLYDGYGKQHNLTEGGIVGYGGPKNKDEIGGAGGTVFGNNNIWRNVVFAQTYTDGLWMTKYADQVDVAYNKIYNNTFWHGGYGQYQVYPTGTAPSQNWDDCYTHPVCIGSSTGLLDESGVHDNSFVNNIFYDYESVYGADKPLVLHAGSSGSGRAASLQDMRSNWNDTTNGDPKFTDVTAGEGTPANIATQWDFTLQSDSTAIDGGTYLTTTVGTGSSSTTLIVADANYFFYDAGNVAAAWPTANINSDWIAVGTVGNTVQISSIDYDTNTITLASPISWANGAAVWLYKKSDGVQVLYGSAPDYGAFEYTSEGGTVNGSCGSAHGGYYAAAPASNLCAAGTAGAVTGTYAWTCTGSGEGATNANCTASVVSVSANKSAGRYETTQTVTLTGNADHFLYYYGNSSTGTPATTYTAPIATILMNYDGTQKYFRYRAVDVEDNAGAITTVGPLKKQRSK